MGRRRINGAQEQSAGTDMNNPDSDGDGLPDGWEVGYGLNLNSTRCNTILTETGYKFSRRRRQTNPNAADTDGDGQDDGGDPYPNDPANGEMSDSDGDGIPDAYDQISRVMVLGTVALKAAAVQKKMDRARDKDRASQGQGQGRGTRTRTGRGGGQGQGRGDKDRAGTR